jgi:6-pyruvoyltetrahydropterin/6-carboxytetrahydropterin synthase
MDVDFLKNVITSSENIVVSIWNQLDEPIKATGCSLHKIKLVETENNYVEYYGE